MKILTQTDVYHIAGGGPDMVYTHPVQFLGLTVLDVAVRYGIFRVVHNTLEAACPVGTNINAVMKAGIVAGVGLVSIYKMTAAAE